MSRLNWNRPRPVFERWYERLDRDILPEPRPVMKAGRVRRSAAKPASAPRSPAGAADAFSRPAVLRTWDLVQARAALAMAAEAVVFCDGCSEPNPGTEGMGAVILVGAERIELYNGGGQGTNNSAELGAALLALEALPPQCRVTVYSDSQYAIFGMTKWLDGWRRKGFVRGGEAIPNAALWRCLDEINSGRSIRWEWVRGHNGNRGNELADELATLGRQSGLCRSLGARWMA